MHLMLIMILLKFGLSLFFRCTDWFLLIFCDFKLFIIDFTLNSLPAQCWVIFHSFLLSADFFQNQLFWKNLSGIPSECQTVWIQIRPDILSVLVWVQIVCKGFQQTILGGKDLIEISTIVGSKTLFICIYASCVRLLINLSDLKCLTHRW